MIKVKLVEVDFEFISDISFFGIEEFEKSGLYKVFLGSRNIVEDIADEIINSKYTIERNNSIKPVVCCINFFMI